MSLGAEAGRTGPEIGYDAIEAEEPIHPKCRRMLDCWLARCPQGDVPSRRDINPLDLPALMGGMFVAEPVDDGTDIRCRLSGTANEQRLGMTFTGRLMSECYEPKVAAELIDLTNRIMSTLRPVVIRGNFVGIDLEFAHFECIYLPVRANTGLQVFGGLNDMVQPD